MDHTISWLLEGDVSVQYMTHKLLLDSNQTLLDHLQEKISGEGFGAEFLSRQTTNGHWGLYYYQPKWTSTHYTLLDLKNLGLPRTFKACQDMVRRMFDECTNLDGGMNLSKYDHPSDTCVDGMVLNYAAYFCPDEPRLVKLAEHLLSVQKRDGGFSWDIESDKGDPHTTICVLEGCRQYNVSGSEHRVSGMEEATEKAIEFLLANRLFIADADVRFRKLSYPYRYRYNLLRVLEYFVDQQVPYDVRMQPALDWLQGKRKPDGRWHLEHQHKGNVHFTMEDTRKPSRFITLKALYIRRYFQTVEQD